MHGNLKEVGISAVFVGIVRPATGKALIFWVNASKSSNAQPGTQALEAPKARCFCRDTINRLLTPDITTLWVVGFLLLCTFLLNTMVFQPILRIIDARATAVRGAKELAESAAQKATAAAAEYDQKLNTARGEVYGQMDDMRKSALDKRAESSRRHSLHRRTGTVGGESACAAGIERGARRARSRRVDPGRRDCVARIGRATQ